jgi:hypothetical protein
VNGTQYFWYDDDIAGWRAEATHDQPSRSGGAPLAAGGEGWVVTKDRPFGATFSEWIAHRDDAYWQSRLLTAHNASASSGAPNEFDPFEALGGGAVSDHRIVHARRY